MYSLNGFFSCQMPSKYKRKSSVIRGNWTEEALKNAMNAVKNDNVRIKTNNDIKGGMGPSCVLRVANEKRLAKHIKRNASSWFSHNH